MLCCLSAIFYQCKYFVCPSPKLHAPTLYLIDSSPNTILNRYLTTSLSLCTPVNYQGLILPLAHWFLVSFYLLNLCISPSTILIFTSWPALCAFSWHNLGKPSPFIASPCCLTEPTMGVGGGGREDGGEWFLWCTVLFRLPGWKPVIGDPSWLRMITPTDQVKGFKWVCWWLRRSVLETCNQENDEWQIPKCAFP